MSVPGADLKDAASRPLSVWQTMRAVAWSFFGVRRSSGYADDVQRLNPVHVIIGGLVAAIGFVVGLVLLVRWIVGSGVAQG
jgi:hypothetical protein